MSTTETFVIVGGGLAGAKAAQVLREEGFDGRVVARDAVWAHEEGHYEANDIELRTDALRDPGVALGDLAAG